MSVLAIIMGAASRSPFDPEARLTDANVAAGDRFGHRVAISSDGSTCAVSAFLDDNTGGIDAGSVYVFVRSGGAWSLQQRLQAGDAGASDNFGGAVALSADGNTLAVGAAEDDNTGGADAGSVYVFTRSGGVWTPQQRLQATDAAAGDAFGYAIALSADGNTVAVGAPDDGNSGGSRAGSVYVLTRSGGVWTPQQRLQATDAATLDLFGFSVAISADGNTCAIGAPFDDNAGDASGTVYVFTRTAGVWSQQPPLQAGDAAATDQFGYAVALSADGNTCAAGAMLDDNSGGTNAGSVYVFTRSAGVWSQQQRLQATDAAALDQFGVSLALSADGSVCAIGATDRDVLSDDEGAVYVFTRSAGTWTQLGPLLRLTDAQVDDRFGTSVALSGDGRRLVASAPWRSSRAGVVQTFVW